MSQFDRHESNRFAEAAAAVGQDYLEARGKILSDGAGRGFPLVPGEGLGALIQAGLKARQKLTQEHGKIYGEERERLLELSTFNLKLIVEQVKLTMLVYRNALKRYSEEVEHELRGQEINNELLVEQEEIGMAALRLLKEQVRLTLQGYQNDIRSQVLALKLLLDEGKIDLNLLVRLARLTVEEEFLIALEQNELLNVDQLLLDELRNIRLIGEDKVVTTKASALQQTSVETVANDVSTQWIGKI
jgi:hypothetical protein